VETDALLRRKTRMSGLAEQLAARQVPTSHPRKHAPPAVGVDMNGMAASG
jgi:hypothetical protein